MKQVMRPYFVRTGGLLLLGVSLAGCKFSASASADVKSGADAKSEASASGSTSGQPTLRDLAMGRIQFKEGKLDYSGVINFEYDKADLKKDKETESTLAEFKKFLAEH